MKYSFIFLYRAIVCLLCVALCLPALANITTNCDDIISGDTLTNAKRPTRIFSPQEPGKIDNNTVPTSPQNSKTNDSNNTNTVPGTDSLKTAKKPSAKKEKPTKLDTYVFTDSALKAQPIFLWQVNNNFNNPTLVKIDTLINENKTELPFYKKDVGATYLGVTGSATLTHNYFKHTSSEVFSFLDPYSDYVFTPDNIKFYNTKVPYSELAYYTSGSKRVSEDNLGVLFTANVQPNWNIGLQYQRFGAKGLYQNQTTKAKSLVLFTSYTGKRYVAHAGYVYNGITNKENGGIVDDYFLVDTTMDAGAIDVWLKSAQNKLRNNTFFLTHSYGVPIEVLNKNRDSTKLNGGTMVYFGHAFNYSRYSRIYTDGTKDAETGYYDRYYLSKTMSYDSSFTSTLNNKLFIKLQPWSSNFWISNIDGGIGYRFERYYTFQPSSYLYGKGNDNYSTAYVYGEASGAFKKYFGWKAYLNYHLTGYQQNDLLFDATAKISAYPLAQGVHLEGRFTFDNRQPSYFTQHYYSNHAQWNNSFDKIQETKLQLTLSIPDWKAEAGFSNSLINKPVYYGLDGLPAQSSDVINISALYVQKNFKLGIVHLDHRLLMQITSNKDIIPLPLFSGNIFYYIESEWVKSVLNTQVGFDVYYNTKFYDYAYNPAVGMFHVQNEKQLGSYPWIDLVANFKWKRANIYFKLTNVAEGFIGERDYFSALHYPRNHRMFRIGIRWHFFT